MYSTLFMFSISNQPKCAGHGVEFTKAGETNFTSDLLFHTQKVAKFLCGQMIFLLTKAHEQKEEVSPQ